MIPLLGIYPSKQLKKVLLTTMFIAVFIMISRLCQITDKHNNK